MGICCYIREARIFSSNFNVFIIKWRSLDFKSSTEFANLVDWFLDSISNDWQSEVQKLNCKYVQEQSVRVVIKAAKKRLDLFILTKPFNQSGYSKVYFCFYQYFHGLWIKRHDLESL